jgi:Flp pilus assembly protein TadG
MRSFIYRNCHYLLSAARLESRGAHPSLGSGAAPAPSARGFFGDRSGVVAVLVALAVPVLLGLTAFAVDVAQWSSGKNSIQGAADNSALSAVVAAGAGATPAQIQNQALAIAAATGFTNGSNGVTVTVNNPPASGPNTANAGAYEVIITQPQTRHYAVLLGAAPTVSGRAVALVASNPACVLALDPSASSAILISGGAGVGAPNCAIAANSSSGTAVDLSGGATLNASNLNIVGNYTTSGGATVTATIKTGAPATADPYASLAVPSFSGCNYTNYTLSGGAATISQGVYCGGITVSGGSTLTMNSGVYILNGNPSHPGNNPDSFTVSGGSTVTGSGVSIILTSNTGNSNDWGNVDISGGTTVTLTAPSSGAMQGVAFYMDRNAPFLNNHDTATFSGGASMSITGSLCFPSEQANYSGGTSSGSVCTQLIADTVNLSGGANFGHACGSLTVPGLQGSGTKGVPAE